jgi:hypothetical protein
LMMNYFKSEFEKEINKALLEMGIDKGKQDFNSEEEQQQHIQMVQEAEESLTPEQIHTYLKTSWKTVGVKWAEHTLKADK